MSYFVFYNPTRIVFGAGVIDKLGKELKNIALKSPILVVIGQGSVKKTKILEKVLHQLEENGIRYFIYEGVSPNPTTLQVEEATKISKKENCQAILALGGGSVMDAAKAIAVTSLSDTPIWDYTSSFLSKGKPIEKALPIITIPTVAATGSEANPIAVINNPATKEKNSISGLPLFPQLALIDPELTLSCPEQTTIDGLIDIIAHSIETYFSVKETVPIPDGITEVICRTVIENGKKLLDNLFDIEARTQISWASMTAMAGFLSGRNGGWPMHAIEHAISGLYPSITHGKGLAAIMIPLLEWNIQHTGLGKFPLFIRRVLDKEVRTREGVIQALHEMLHSLKATTSLEKLGVKKSDIPLIAQNVLKIKRNKENKLINIEPMTEEDIISVLEKSY